MFSGRASFDGLAEAGASHQRTIERVIAVMRERVDGTLPLSEMAEITHLSPYHFARTFWRITGVPPGGFMGALRRDRAKETLLTTDLSLSEVCFEVGYNTSGPSPRASNNSSASVRAGYAPCPRIWPLPSKLLVRAFEPYPDRLRGGTGFSFRVADPDLEGALIFVGLFTGTVPQGRPVASTLLLASGPYRLAPVPDGLYHLMTAALSALLRQPLRATAARRQPARGPRGVSCRCAKAEPRVALT